jgi:hypothetical protein
MHPDAKNSTTARHFGLGAKPLTMRDLPSSLAVKWTVRRKAAVIHAVHSGLLSLGEASVRFALSSEEFRSWEIMLDRFGQSVLPSGRIQHAKPGRQNISFHYH